MVIAMGEGVDLRHFPSVLVFLIVRLPRHQL